MSVCMTVCVDVPADGEQNDALTGNQKKDRSRSPGRRRKDIVAETQLDSPDGKQQGTKKLKLGSPNKSFYPPSDPDDAKRKGWSEVDLGGDGDCFYRCISYFLEKDPSKVTPEFAKNAASFIRVKLVAHARKHENRFAEFFPSTRGFAEWADATLQNNTWIEGAALQACSERNGLAIVIWSWRPKDNSWTRFTIAPRFSDGQACWAKGTSPATVILRNKHYTVLKPPEDTKTPISWLRETPNTVIDFSGVENQRQAVAIHHVVLQKLLPFEPWEGLDHRVYIRRNMFLPSLCLPTCRMANLLLLAVGILTRTRH